MIEISDLAIAIFASAVFLFVLSMSKLIANLASFVYSEWIYRNTNVGIMKEVLTDMLGTYFTNNNEDQINENILRLFERFSRKIWEPFIEATASIVLLLIIIVFFETDSGTHDVILLLLAILIAVSLLYVYQMIKVVKNSISPFAKKISMVMEEQEKKED